MVTKIKQVLAFFRLLNENGNLSLTNAFAIITLYKYIKLDQVTLDDMGAFLLIIGAYEFKRYTQRKGK